MPKIRLLKFSPFGRHSYEVIANAELYFSDPSGFNDPFDCCVPLDVDDEGYFSFVKDRLNAEGKFRSDFEAKIIGMSHSFVSDFWKGYFNNIRISSFSNNTDGKVIKGPLLWAHYADKNKGIAFEFEVEYKEGAFGQHVPKGFSIPGGKIWMSKINYSKTLPKVTFAGPESSLEMARIVRTKCTDWLKEKEVRMVLEGDGGSRYRSAFVGFEKVLLKRIYFGIAFEREVLWKFMKFVRNHGYETEFFRMDFSNRFYKMVKIMLQQED